MKFSENLILLRKSKGLSQEALAEKMNISRQAISKWENDDAYPDLPKLLILCEILQVSLDELCGIASNTKIISDSSKRIAPQKNKMKKVLLLVSMIVIGFFSGILWNRIFYHPIPNNIPIKDFKCLIYRGNLNMELVLDSYQEQLTYTLVLSENNKKTTQQSLECDDGFCRTIEEMNPIYETPTISLKVSNGLTSRSFPIAKILDFRYDGVTYDSYWEDDNK